MSSEYISRHDVEGEPERRDPEGERTEDQAAEAEPAEQEEDRRHERYGDDEAESNRA